MCKPVVDGRPATATEKAIPTTYEWKCVLGYCQTCNQSTHNNINRNEVSNSVHKVEFMHYVKHTKCTKHGRLEYNSKTCEKCDELIKMGLKPGRVLKPKADREKEIVPISTFMLNYYIPFLKKFKYHHSDVMMSRQVLLQFKEAFNADPHTIYTE